MNSSRKLPLQALTTSFSYFSAVGWRHGLQAISAILSSLFFVGMFYRSASLYHPQRRAILHLKDMSKKKGKDKAKIENKPPYFDFSTLRLKSLQVILLCTFLTSFGAYSPIIYFVSLFSIIFYFFYDNRYRYQWQWQRAWVIAL